jgi:mannose-1-phosphate guanylyltransferase
MDSTLGSRAAIILAGGDGNRLGSYIRKTAGSSVPKQFFTLLGDVSMLEDTRRRVFLSIPPSHSFYALNVRHARYYSPLLADVPPENLVEQPSNRGTAPAILCSLLRIAAIAPCARVLLMPSDHYIEDELALMKYVELAFNVAERRSDLVFLLGAEPKEPDPSYGWIEPGIAVSGTPRDVFEVRRFVEKPPHELALRLMRSGSLWNTFIIVAHLSTLLELYVATMPEVCTSFAGINSGRRHVFDTNAMEQIYQRIPSTDFSRDVLEHAAQNLCVISMKDVGWNDLGEPRRVGKIRARIAASQSTVAALR